MWTLDVKIQLRSVFLIIFWFAAPFLSCRTLRRHPWVLVLKLAAPLELLTAPWLRTTGLDNKMLIKFLFNNFSWCLKWSKTHSANVHPIPDPGAGEGVSLQSIPHPTTENRNCSSGLYFIQLFSIVIMYDRSFYKQKQFISQCKNGLAFFNFLNMLFSSAWRNAKSRSGSRIGGWKPKRRQSPRPRPPVASGEPWYPRPTRTRTSKTKRPIWTRKISRKFCRTTTSWVNKRPHLT